MKPTFSNNLSIPVKNHLTGSTYLLKRVDEVEVTDQMLEQLISIGNESRVYSWIFEERLKGEAYGMEMAKGFFEIGHQGWRDREQFTFILLTENGNPAASIDIKTADINGAEIGYLSSIEHRGVMTNTVTALAKIAKSAGYNILWARCLKANKESARVLVRAKFTQNEERSRACDAYNYYELKISD